MVDRQSNLALAPLRVGARCDRVACFAIFFFAQSRYLSVDVIIQQRLLVAVTVRTLVQLIACFLVDFSQCTLGYYSFIWLGNIKENIIY